MTSKLAERVLAVVLVAVAMVFLAPPIIIYVYYNWLPNCDTIYCGSEVAVNMAPVVGILLLILFALVVCLYSVFLAAFNRLRR